MGISSIKPINFGPYITTKAKVTTNYLIRKANDAKVDTKGLKWFERAMVASNRFQGEHFNNIVTAVGTAGVAPIFIINNPLAKEDINTKKYTAARQPISAVITLAGQVPIMMAYNKMLDDYVTKHRLDRCDLHAAPTRGFFKDAINGETREFLLKHPELAQEMNKADIQFVKDLIYDKKKNSAFYEELDNVRKIVHSLGKGESLADAKPGTLKSVIAKCLDQNNDFKIESLISPADYDFAEKQLIQEYMKDKHKIISDEKTGKIIQIGDTKIEDTHLQKEIKKLSDLRKGAIKKLLKANGIEISKEEFAALKAGLTPDIIKEQAIKNVEAEILTKAKIKFNFAKMAKEAKAVLLDYKAELMKQGKSEAEIIAMIEEKNYQLFNDFIAKAKEILKNAPAKVPAGDSSLDAREAKILVGKLQARLETVIDPTNENLSLRDKLRKMIYNCFDGETKIKFLKTENRETLEQTIKDQKAKKWLTARINNSQKVMKNFKQISGLIVGLCILPITCGVLNWAYPRIMEEFFPKLAHAKSKPAETKEAK